MAAEPSPSGKSLLQAIAQQDPDATYLLDRFCRIQTIRGDGAGPIRTGADLFDTIPESQRENVRECLNAVRESGDSGRFDVLLYSNLNEPVHWENRVIAIREGGVVNGFLIFATNLSRVLESALEREAFFEEAAEVFCVLNMDGRIRDLNASCCELLGGSRDQLTGMPLVNYVSQDDSHRLREAMTSITGHRQKSASLTVRHVGITDPVNWSMTVSARTERIVMVATVAALDGDHGDRARDRARARVEPSRSTPSMTTNGSTIDLPGEHNGAARTQDEGVDESRTGEASPIPLTASETRTFHESEPLSQNGSEIADLYVQEFNSRLMSIMTNVELGRLSDDPGRVKRYLSQIEQEAQRASEMTRKMVSWRDEPARNRDTVPDDRQFIRTSQRTVLIAEDDELVSDVVVKILEQASYRVLVCRNGKEAVEMCRRHDDVDLILLDVVMPVMSGPEAASQIALIRPEIPVLFTSGFVGDSLTNANIPAGAPLLKKPYQTDALLKVIEEHIGPAQESVGNGGTAGRTL